MEVTGYQLKDAIKAASLTLSTVQTQFEETLFKFDDEDKEAPNAIADKIDILEEKVAKLQTAQSVYNLNVAVEVLGKEILLEEAIKRVGGAGRLSKMWRTAAKGSKRDRWTSIQANTRKEGEEVAKATITKAAALEEAIKAERLASALRSAISVGNTKKVSIDWVDEDLLS